MAAFLKNTLFPAALALVLSASCSDALEESPLREGLYATTTPFELVPSTKVVYSKSNLDCVWEAGDVIGVCPQSDASAFEFTVNAADAGKSSASFDGASLRLRENVRYAGFYPFDGERAAACEDSRIFGISMQNRSIRSWDAIDPSSDYMYALPAFPEGGRLDMSFRHLNAVLRFNMSIPCTAAWAECEIVASEGFLCDSYTVQLSPEQAVIGKRNLCTSLSARLGKSCLTANAGDRHALDFAVAPFTTPSGAFVTVILKEADGTRHYARCIPPAEVAAGKVYDLELVFDEQKESATKRWIILSDIHLGDSRAIEGKYGWSLHQRHYLASFFDALVRKSADWDELVINGDFFDEWVCPADIRPLGDSYGNRLSEREFVANMIETNRDVFDALYRLRDHGKKLHYVPGNHDMQVTAEDLETLLPGLFQCHYDSPGMGHYTPADAPILRIEHSHRYDIYNAPYPVSYQDGSSSILPPGFFISRLVCDYGQSQSSPDYQPLTKAAQNALILTFSTGFKTALLAKCADRYKDMDYRVLVDYDDNLPKDFCCLEGLSGGDVFGNSYSIYQSPSDSWKSRCKALGAIEVPGEATSVMSSILYSILDDMAYSCVLKLKESWAAPIRICVWGHSHSPAISSKSVSGKGTVIYANTGSWVDSQWMSGDDYTTSYVVVTKSESQSESTYTVELKQYDNYQFVQKGVKTLSVSK